ncbi:glutamate-gated chloride channel-like, partial [Tropilaelaps mercedesae]
ETKVNVSVLLLSMSSPDESSLKYEIEFLLIQKWVDQRLAYHETGSNHSHLNGLLHEAKIWKPDIYFIKHASRNVTVTKIQKGGGGAGAEDMGPDKAFSTKCVVVTVIVVVADVEIAVTVSCCVGNKVQWSSQSQVDSLTPLGLGDETKADDDECAEYWEFKTPLNPVHMSLRLYPNGTVVYTMRRHMTLVCQGNLQIFPFDNPKCPFAVESMSYEEKQLKIDWSKEHETITRASSLRALNAYLAKNETGYCDKRHTWRGNYSCLRVLLVFTRDKSFYISTVFVPGIVLVTSSFISFWLDINAVPARQPREEMTLNQGTDIQKDQGQVKQLQRSGRRVLRQSTDTDEEEDSSR